MTLGRPSGSTGMEKWNELHALLPWEGTDNFLRWRQKPKSEVYPTNFFFVAILVNNSNSILRNYWSTRSYMCCLSIVVFFVLALQRVCCFTNNNHLNGRDLVGQLFTVKCWIWILSIWFQDYKIIKSRIIPVSWYNTKVGRVQPVNSTSFSRSDSLGRSSIAKLYSNGTQWANVQLGDKTIRNRERQKRILNTGQCATIKPVSKLLNIPELNKGICGLGSYLKI